MSGVGCCGIIMTTCCCGSGFCCTCTTIPIGGMADTRDARFAMHRRRQHQMDTDTMTQKARDPMAIPTMDFTLRRAGGQDVDHFEYDPLQSEYVQYPLVGDD